MRATMESMYGQRVRNAICDCFIVYTHLELTKDSLQIEVGRVSIKLYFFLILILE